MVKVIEVKVLEVKMVYRRWRCRRCRNWWWYGGLDVFNRVD